MRRVCDSPQLHIFSHPFKRGLAVLVNQLALYALVRGQLALGHRHEAQLGQVLCGGERFTVGCISCDVDVE